MCPNDASLENNVGIKKDPEAQPLQLQRDGKPQERVPSPNPQPRELVSANVGTLLDQTIERLFTGNRTV